MPKQLETRFRGYLRKHDGKSELLFTNQRNRPYSANKLRADLLHPLLKRLGIPRGGFHAKITLEHYAHVIGDQQRDAVENWSARLVN